METIVSIIAGILTTSCFIPQAIKVIKTRQTHDISLIMYILFVLGVAHWLVFGILINSVPIIIANIVTLILASIILYIKVKEG